jgi:UDP-N-acetylmuramate dehydrogenase
LAKKARLPIFVIGAGTNVLVGDSGFKGIVLHLGSPHFKKIRSKGTTVTAGAGCNMSALVRFCCERSLGGLESLVGIPGTVGGAVYMNAGGWSNPIFRNIGDFITHVKVMDRSGRIKVLGKKTLRFGYRRSNLGDHIVLEARLKLNKDKAALLKSRCAKFMAMKRQKQALDVPSAGCVFKNPEDFQFTCGQMIDMLGLKGRACGGAEISEKHANFIINRRGARSSDVLKLIELVKNKVKENYNVALELEIKII